MDGIHDLGGMQGFAPVNPDDDVVGFHEQWEGLVHSAFVGTLGSGVHNMDEFRHAIERIEPRHYLNAAYYDRWLMGVSTLAVENGAISADELRERTAAMADGEATITERRDPTLIDDLIDGVVDAYSAWEEDREPAFESGDEVRVRHMHPDGHTRCPGYVRNARGTITDYRGTHTLPDAHAHGGGGAEPVYNVAFELNELWNDDGDGDSTGNSDDVVRIELWESYLEGRDE
jgi:nitrile hydratase